MSEERRTRRRFLSTATAGLALGLAGCSGQSGSEQPSPGSGTSRPPTATETTTAVSESSSTTREPAETTDEASPATETTDSEPPYYKQDHWHGRLFFEVNGELVDFDRPRYYLDNIENERPETVYFHFHDGDAHGPNEWSNEKQTVTLQRALNLLPGIGYEQQSGNHVLSHDGTTYRGGNSGTSITIKEGTRSIDPTSYQVEHGDDYYVQIITGDDRRNAEPAHNGAELGTLLFDLNNVRVDFSREKFLGEEAASESFHFHDDGSPYMWYKEEATTLSEALNSLPGIGYEQDSGNHVLTYDDEGTRAIYDQTYDGGTSAHEIVVKQRTNPIDPTSYELQAGDVIWVYVQSELLPSNVH